jgi:hypothetical protein
MGRINLLITRRKQEMKPTDEIEVIRMKKFNFFDSQGII